MCIRSFGVSVPMGNNLKKLSQNIQHLLMEIGEKMVAFHLHLKTRGTPWEVYSNLGEVGCDLLLINRQSAEKIRVEVKTRQRLYTTGKHRNQVQFTVTETEYNHCDFVIGYWLERNEFFVIPRDALVPTSSKGKRLYKFVVQVKRDGKVSGQAKEFLNQWNLVTDRINP